MIPEAGVAVILPSRAGVLREVYVREGSVVRQGQPLASVRVAEVLTSGGASSDQISQALAEQEASLSSQTSALSRVSREEAARRSEQARGLSSELRELSAQIEIQRQLVSTARETLERMTEAGKNGFISRRDIIAREESYLVRQQQLSQLEQARAGKLAALEDARRGLAQLSAQASADAASARFRFGELGRQRIAAGEAEGYVLTAPVAGRATAIAARIGQTVDPSSPLMSVLPASSSLRAELMVPATVIGYLRAGQEVHLVVDGLPAEQFGTVAARIVTVPAATVSTRDGQGNVSAVYPVICEIARDEIASRAERLKLVASMTVTARIVTRKQSILQWLVEPFVAVAQR